MKLRQWMENGIINTGNLARWQRVMRKAADKQPLTIGFLGGSITMGSLSSRPETCYAYRVYEWFRETFDYDDIVYINAGIGATTSQFGIARVQEDLLSYEPDIVFLEFSVNDQKEEKFKETFEGLIRKILLSATEPALFMFNNVEYDTGNSAQKIHNELGFYYDLPIVSMRESIYQEINKGNIVREKMTPDNLHPNDFGHELVAGVIITLLEKIKAASFGAVISEVPMKKPLTNNSYYDSHRYNNKSKVYTEHGFVKDKDTQYEISDVFKNGWRADKAGDSITFLVSGTHISIQYRKSVKHPAPVAKVTIDDETEAVLDANFTETWGDCLYLQDVLVHGKQGSHKVVITVTDSGSTESFYLNSVITA